MKFFSFTKGFGFIAPDERGNDVFVHVSALETSGNRNLKKRDRVTFVLDNDRKARGKKHAADLKKI